MAITGFGRRNMRRGSLNPSTWISDECSATGRAEPDTDEREVMKLDFPKIGLGIGRATGKISLVEMISFQLPG